MKKLLLGLILLVPFSAVSYTGDELLIDCHWYIDVNENKGTTGNIGKSLSAGRCQGFISGLVYSYNHFVKNNIIQQNVFCLTGNVNTTQLAKTIVRYLENNEPIIESLAVDLSIDALKEAYTCDE